MWFQRFMVVVAAAASLPRLTLSKNVRRDWNSLSQFDKDEYARGVNLLKEKVLGCVVVLCCIVLCCIVLCCIVLCCGVVWCVVL